MQSTSDAKQQDLSKAVGSNNATTTASTARQQPLCTASLGSTTNTMSSEQQPPVQLMCHTCGLMNSGNTCYINAATQCLANIRPLKRLLVLSQQLSASQKDDACQEANDFTSHTIRSILIKKWKALASASSLTRSQMQRLERLKLVLLFGSTIDTMWKHSEPTNIIKMIRQFWQLYPHLGSYSQQDSEEYFRQVLDNIHEELNLLRHELRGQIPPTIQTQHASAALSQQARSRQAGTSNGADESGSDAEEENNTESQGEDEDGDEEMEDVDSTSEEDEAVPAKAASEATSSASSPLPPPSAFYDSPEKAVDEDDEFDGYERDLKEFLIQYWAKACKEEALERLEKFESSQQNSPATPSDSDDSRQQQPRNRTIVTKRIVPTVSRVRTPLTPNTASEEHSVLCNPSLTRDQKLERLIQLEQRRRPRKPVTEISKIFAVEQLQETTCCHCGHVSQRVQREHSLHFSIPDSRTKQLILDSKRRESQTPSGSQSDDGSEEEEAHENTGHRAAEAMKRFVSNAYTTAKTNLFGCFESLVSTFTGTDDVIGMMSSCSLEDVLDLFFLPAQLRGDNKYFCSHCKAKHNASQTLRLVRVPPVLIMHLKRFERNGVFTAKVSTQVQFDETLVLPERYLRSPRDALANACAGSVPASPIDRSRSTSSSSSASGTSSDYNIPLTSAVAGQQPATPLAQSDRASPSVSLSVSPTYRLRAVINHHGSYYGGHYTSFVRTDDGQWWDCNDSSVTRADFSEVKSSQAYVLFYELDRAEQPSFATSV